MSSTHRIVQCPKRTLALTCALSCVSTYLTVFYMLWVSPLWADFSSGPQVEKINSQIEIENARLESVIKAETQTESRLDGLQDDIKKLERLKQENTELVDHGLKERERLKTELAEIEKNLKEMKSEALGRINMMYVLSQRSTVERLIFSSLSDKSSFDVGRQAYFLEKIRDHDLGLVRTQAELRRERITRQSELEANIASTRTKQRELRQQSDSLALKVWEQKAVARDLKLEREQVEQSLSVLRAQALRLETVVASLVDGPPEHTQKQSKAKQDLEEGTTVVKFEGNGLSVVRGKLPAPASATVLKRFGRYKHSEFADIVFSKGVELKVAQGAVVKAVSSGRVSFVGKLPGYGLVIILDHGLRYHTLYARLARVTVAQGEIVPARGVVGMTGIEDSRGRNLYFEVRHGGKAVDPRKFVDFSKY